MVNPFSIIFLISIISISNLSYASGFRISRKSAKECSIILANIHATHHPMVQYVAKDGLLLNGQMKKDIEMLLDDLAQLTQGKLSLPANLKVDLGSKDGFVYYSNNVIYATTDYMEVGYKKHPKHTQAVLAHEWGHALLELNLLERFPELLHNQKNLDAYRLVFAPYSELFADIVPVMRAKNGRAVRVPIFSSTHSVVDNNSAKMRDFTINHKLSGWDYEGPYALFAPSRSWLWETYLSRPHVQREPGKVLDALVETLGNEISYRMQNPLVTLNPEQINQRFMDSFTQSMKKREL